MQFVGPALMIGGKLFGGIAANKAGKKSKAAAYAQATEEERAGEAQALRLRDTARKAIGEQLAGQFSNGFFGGTGSALDALTESQVNAALDVAQLRRDAAGRARAYRAEGDQRAAEGKNALIGSLIGSAAAGFGANQDWAQARAAGG